MLRRLFALVAAVVLVDTMFYAAITPLLPHYAAELHLSKSEAGVLSASYAAGTLLGSLPGGWLAARAGVRRTLISGLAMMSAASVAFAFASQVHVLDVARFVQGIGGALSWTGGVAWLLAAATRERRGGLIGSALAAAIAGVLLGPVLGGAATVVGPEPVFSAVGLLGVALMAWTIATPGAVTGPAPRVADVGRAIASRPVVTATWLIALPALFSGVLGVLAPLRLDVLGAGGVAIGGIFLAAAAVEAVLSRILGDVSDRRGRMAPIRIGLVLGGLAAAAMPAPATVMLLAVAVLAAVVATGFIWAPAMALLSDAAEQAGLDQGFALALVNLAWAAGQVLGGSGGARFAEATADGVPYLAVAAMFGATWLAVARMGGRSRIEWQVTRSEAE